MTSSREGKVLEVVRSFLENKYGSVEFEISRVYERGEVFEVSGSFNRLGERTRRRFTLLIDSKEYVVKGFGLR
ncbi:MAG: hypothetical protein RMI49_02800 [Candidatus Caldarchaeum sp.]|nr:hypothetical protein [Candidatus Caldarchaeum sp.]